MFTVAHMPLGVAVIVRLGDDRVIEEASDATDPEPDSACPESDCGTPVRTADK
jgi:hypothetical protein